MNLQDVQDDMRKIKDYIDIENDLETKIGLIHLLDILKSWKVSLTARGVHGNKRIG